ncbi:chemotaxis protein CheA [Halodesulfurarchaeum formicicum]|uniref:Chemotaxis protein CheA n=1 Tax=Halodesulfurarchaeum formicicum TaxID=1873524 RepID=A0A1D8S5B3_9EURY|nr:chemotaxis protein CheA [Halodesulfurarchaeum formicicum]AOW80546.1 chemotaxis protein CheA [Halodesulfurarchaeum formicicum]
MEDYLEEFVREGEDHVTELNNALLTLESDPEDDGAMERIFRTAHTLKGNFGAMGFEDASDLAHAVEDLLDAMRQGEIAVTADRMDHIFAGVDEIEACLDEIEADGEVARDVRPTITDLRAVLDGADEPATETAAQESTTEDVAFDPATLDADGERVVQATVEMADSEMPGVDAMFVLEDIQETFDVLGAVPKIDAIEDGEYDTDFTLALATDAGDVASEIAENGDVTNVTVQELDTESEGSETETAADNAGESGTDSVGEIQSVRVNVDQLDELHGLVEQLVTTRIKLRRSVGENDRRTEEELDDLDKITSNLQDTVMDMRLVPMKKIVGKFPRLVRDLAREEDKQVEFTIEGDDVELDRTILTEISDPLMHILRNAVDHGIESPEKREAAGKDPTGSITLRAERERDRVKIQVIDDGQGVDHDAIRTKAVEKGILDSAEAEDLTEDEVAELIFHSGFSTTEEVTDVSGRGVGMDVVNDTVTRLDGSVSVTSEPGEGTTVTLTLPVTVAIVKVLFVESGGEKYGIPIKTIDEISRMRPLKQVDGEEVVTYDDTVYPLVRLGDALDVPGETRNGDGMLVKIRDTERQVALHCDAVQGQEEVVVKPFEGILSGIPGLSGAAVLGEGDVVTILDVATL